MTVFLVGVIILRDPGPQPPSTAVVQPCKQNPSCAISTNVVSNLKIAFLHVTVGPRNSLFDICPLVFSLYVCDVMVYICAVIFYHCFLILSSQKFGFIDTHSHLCDAVFMDVSYIPQDNFAYIFCLSLWPNYLALFCFN